MNDFDNIAPSFPRSKKRSKKNRETKFCLVFDEKDRVEFLTGFKKRKDERRKRAQEQMVAQLKEEKRQVKEKKREEIRNRRQHERGVPEVDHILKGDEIDLPNHTVTVTEVEPLVLDDDRLGFNKVSDDEGDRTRQNGSSVTTDRKPTQKGAKTSSKQSKKGGVHKSKHGGQAGKHGGPRNKHGGTSGARGRKFGGKRRGGHKR